MARKPVTIGVDLGGTKLVAALVDGTGEVSSLQRWPRRVASYDDALDAIAELTARLRDDASEPVAAVGVAIAAFVEPSRDRVRRATNLPGWEHRPLRDDLTDRLGLPVIVENDGDAAAWGEYVHGAGRGEPCVVMATVGTGIGGGSVVGGRLLAGGFGVASEFGHLQVVPDGLPCGCGARGCLEAYASGTAVTRAVRAAAETDPARARRLLERAGGEARRIDGPLITALAHEGDALARDALATAGRWLGLGLAQVAAVLDPSVVLIGGGLAEAAGDLIVEPARAAYGESLSIRRARPVAPVRQAAFGNAAGIVGAAALAASTRSQTVEIEMS